MTTAAASLRVALEAVAGVADARYAEVASISGPVVVTVPEAALAETEKQVARRIYALDGWSVKSAHLAYDAAAQRVLSAVVMTSMIFQCRPFMKIPRSVGAGAALTSAGNLGRSRRVVAARGKVAPSASRQIPASDETALSSRTGRLRRLGTLAHPSRSPPRPSPSSRCPSPLLS